ncbi:hypothetical protein AA0113_g12353 [Alternaria arborescens]|uniref:Uncharacterized protein n=1 Tax=Alternaria arborescens TaxID=156630 RepID=A0A4Q4PXB5_9PLEO|nr:hypothetical protein AA0111_g11997 [Alternaria arborescens]RYO14505.1 hypothetical protein AA0111_g11997 [Alternaria arborescens]RYO27009.1 hypothetical protein AA0113_g12353 [Alternaria arborescens]
MESTMDIGSMSWDEIHSHVAEPTPGRSVNMDSSMDPSTLDTCWYAAPPALASVPL